jgi:type I restriction enzyme R subunit
VEADDFLQSMSISLDKIIGESNTLDKLDELRIAYDTIVAKDQGKEQFKVILNTLMNLYEASKPEVFEKKWFNEKFAPLVYLHGLFYRTIDDEKVARARLRMSQLLDSSVTAESDLKDEKEIVIYQSKVIDLSKIDAEELRKEIRTAKYKAIEIDDLKKFIEQVLMQMINKNRTRLKFSQRYKNIIDSYNAGSSENEDYYEQLVQLLEELQKENTRANTEGLTEEELEIYDLLVAGKKLTKAEEQKVKLSAKNLYKKLTENKKSLFMIDWYKDEQPKGRVIKMVKDSLDADLPDAYDKISFNAKVDLLINHFVDMAVQGYGWVGAVA